MSIKQAIQDAIELCIKKEKPMNLRRTEEQYLNYLDKKKPKKKSKYNNKKTEIDEITFDSKKEAEYYCMLKILKQVEEIKYFGLQPKYELQPSFKKNGKKYRSITYIANFVILNLDRAIEVVDVKVVET